MLGDRVLVIPDDVPSESAGGIVLPDVARERMPSRGRVVSVGPGGTDKKGRLRPMTLSPGNEVVYGTLVGQPLTLNGVDHLVLRSVDIFAIDN